MPDDCSFLNIGLSIGNAKMELNRGKNPQKIEKKKSRPTCYKDNNVMTYEHYYITREKYFVLCI